ncbi:MAG: TetR/AcrR family transcriptional regulator [Proteobacteria bacterium]|nr:TetR/AcrR family transcriptional regulator [Pseudomonadota bacterium]
MPRVVKHPDLRRSEFLDHAFGMFLTHGYDNTSLNDIIAKSGTSKGAFYHYFPSKEALLEALADRVVRQAFEGIEHAARAPNLTPLGRLNAFLAASRRFKLEIGDDGWRVFAAMFGQENQILYQRISGVWRAQFKPLVTEIIATGVREKVFETFDSEGVGEVLQCLVSAGYQIITDALAAKTVKERRDSLSIFESRLRLHGIAIDRLLGLPDGSVEIIEPGYAQALMARLPPLNEAKAKAKS